MADAASERFGVDLAVVDGFRANDDSSLDLVERVHQSRGGRELIDLNRVHGHENLAQALILRLLTARGSLASLGHAHYGSRLHELIGRGKTDATRHLCRAHVLEVVAQEPRVESKAVKLEFDRDSEGPSSLRFTLTVRPKSDDDDVRVSVEVGV